MKTLFQKWFPSLMGIGILLFMAYEKGVSVGRHGNPRRGLGEEEEIQYEDSMYIVTKRIDSVYWNPPDIEYEDNDPLYR